MTKTAALTGLTVVALLALPAGAQQTTQIHPGKGGSPHVKTEWAIDGATVSITYGRPYLKGRPLSQLAPHGRIWRTGADEATTLVTDRALRIGETAVPAGTYTLWTVPGEREWQLVISRATGLWGTQYKEGEDLARVPMQVETLDSPVEQFTISMTPQDGGARLTLEWADTRAWVPVTVTQGQASRGPAGSASDPAAAPREVAFAPLREGSSPDANTLTCSAKGSGVKSRTANAARSVATTSVPRGRAHRGH